MNSAADNLRVLIAEMVEKAKSGHPGGSLGAADFINVLYSSFLEYDPEDPQWFARDRFFLDPGHMSPMLYGILALAGKYSMEDLQNFRQWGGVTPGHPELDVARGVENGSGPLGQGHVMAVGCAIAERFPCRTLRRGGGSQRLMLLSPTVVFRRRSRRARAVSQDCSDSTISSCSTTPTKSSSPPR